MAKKESNVTSFNEQEKKFKEKTGKSFSFFYEKYYPKLVYYLTKMSKDVQIAEDITVDSFINAFEKIDQYDCENSQFSTWLFTIGKNNMLAYFKKNNPTISIDVEIDEEGATLKDFIQDTESDVRYQEMIQRKADFVRECISKLKEPYKTIIEMREIDQLEYKVIAEILQLNESTVKSRIRNGRILLENETKKMFKMLEEEYL